jgi:hypothetical protein
MSQQARASTEPPLPQEAYSYAEMYQLGRPVAVYRIVYRTNITLGIVCLFLALLFLGLANSGEASGRSIVLLLLLALPCVAGIIYYLVVYPLRFRSWRIYGCADGFVFLKGSRVMPCRWDQIAFVWQRIVRYYRNGVYAGTSFKFTVQRNDGVQMVITQIFRSGNDLGACIQREVTSRLAPQALASVQHGQTQPFGRFSLSRQGLTTPREMLPWSEVRQVSASGGWLMIQRHDQRKGISYGKVDKIPNLYVFLNVAEALVQRR